MSRRFDLASTVRAALGAAVFSLAAAGSAGAQPMPASPAAPAAPVAPPSYATPSNEEQITGSITAVPGKYALQVRDTRGFIDNVTLHPGTIINPTGLKLAAGMQVSITGVNAGQTFTANQIDAPYAIALVARPDSTIGIGFAPSWGWGPRYRGGFWW
jgi:hypothetical protein